MSSINLVNFTANMVANYSKKRNANKRLTKPLNIATELKKQQCALAGIRECYNRNAEIVANDVLLISNAKILLSHCHELLDDLANRSVDEFVAISEIAERSNATIADSNNRMAKLEAENEELKNKIAFHERCVEVLVLKMNRK